MATPINMPQVGQDLETAKIVEWHVKEGDTVSKGDMIATVESDKASFEVEAFEAGTVLKLLFNEGDDGEVFKPIAYIGEAGETVEGDTDKPSEQKQEVASTPVNSETIATETTGQVKENGKQFISPAAKRVARENNLSVDAISGSGPNNRIIKKDVEALLSGADTTVKATPVAKQIAESEGLNLTEISGTGHAGRIYKNDVLDSMRQKAQKVQSADNDQVVHFDKIRKRIAERLTLSKQTIPHYYLYSDVNVSQAMAWKKQLMEQVGVKVSFNDILIKVVADALKNHPVINAHVDDEKMVLKKDINIGVAVSVENGLLVPVIQHADQLKVAEISAASKKNADDAKRGIINPTIAGTFTISNLGMFGISRFNAIINPPECAILSVGAIEKKVVPVDNGIVTADMVTLGLAVDHRAADGVVAAKFLSEVKSNIENLKF